MPRSDGRRRRGRQPSAEPLESILLLSVAGRIALPASAAPEIRRARARSRLHRPSALHSHGGQQFAFSQAAYQSPENSGTISIPILRTGVLRFPATVTVSTNSSGSAVAGVNYMAAEQSFIFGKRVREETFVVPILDDHVNDGATTVGLSISVTGRNASLRSPAAATLIIQNTDPPQVPAVIQFATASSVIGEDAGTATIQVTRSGNTGIPVSLVVTTTSTGSAVAGVNYIPIEQTLTFAAGVTSLAFAVPVLDDHIDDAATSVGLSISPITSGVLLGGPSTANLVIENVDPPPDLVLESLRADPLFAGGYQVTATLTNEGSNYGGGGFVDIVSNSEATSLNQPLANGSPPSPIAVPLPETQLGSDPIPAMALGQTVVFTAPAANLAMFQAQIVAIAGATTPGISGVTGPTGDVFSIDHRQPQSQGITGSELASALKLDSASAQIDANNSYINIPNLINQTFTVPAIPVTIPVLGTTESFEPNQIRADSFQVAISSGAIVLTVGFADNPQALVSTDGLFSVGVNNLSLTVTLPIVFDSTDQYLRIENQTVVIQGTWTGSILGLNLDLSDTINSAIGTNVSPLLDQATTHEAMEYGLNVQVRTYLGPLRTVRIIALQSGLASLTLEYELS